MSDTHEELEESKYEKGNRIERYDPQQHKSICYSIILYFLLRIVLVLLKTNGPMSKFELAGAHEYTFIIYALGVGIFSIFAADIQKKSYQDCLNISNYVILGILVSYSLKIIDFYSYDVCKDIEIDPDLKNGCKNFLALALVFLLYDLVGIFLFIYVIYHTWKRSTPNRARSPQKSPVREGSFVLEDEDTLAV